MSPSLTSLALPLQWAAWTIYRERERERERGEGERERERERFSDKDNTCRATVLYTNRAVSSVVHYTVIFRLLAMLKRKAYSVTFIH